MNTPRATMRLQFHKDFTFDDATSRVSYFSALGISHLYASPIMTARKGSLHGYDVIDPTRVNPELGGEQALERLVAALRARGMGLIVDIVPNHMAAVTDNPWWADVLARGRQSRYAHFFDIDWEPDDPALRAKVLLPILGKAYGEALAAGEIKLEQDPHRRGLRIRYFEHSLPIAAPDCQQLERAPLDAFDPATPRGREQLHALLERQHYRLAWWGAANDEINWRRFFDINDLAALRMENDEAFEAVHATLFRLYAEGLLDGLRVDHVDGLSHPQEYCRKLGARLRELERERPRSAPAGRAYLVVEKILAANEYLPGAWEADGTTGYDFMDQVSALLHDGAGEEPLSELWCRLDEKTGSFAAVEEQSRRQILERSFSAQLESTVARLSCDCAQRPFDARLVEAGNPPRIAGNPRAFSGLPRLRSGRLCFAMRPRISRARARRREEKLPALRATPDRSSRSVAGGAKHRAASGRKCADRAHALPAIERTALRQSGRGYCLLPLWQALVAQ